MLNNLLIIDLLLQKRNIETFNYLTMMTNYLTVEKKDNEENMELSTDELDLLQGGRPALFAIRRLNPDIIDTSTEGPLDDSDPFRECMSACGKLVDLLDSVTPELVTHNFMGHWADRDQCQVRLDTDKIKCKTLLSFLPRLASDQPETVARNVRSLIQGLIDGLLEPEVFAKQLEKELNYSSPSLVYFLKKYVPFLKKTLPLLQHSLATRELTIDGVNPPSLSQVNVSISGQARIIPLPVTVSSQSSALSGPTGPD